MTNLNSVLLIGGMTRPPEVRMLREGFSVTRVGLAVNRSWKDRKGEWQEEVCFVDVDAWNKIGAQVAQYGKKGDKIFVAGYLTWRQWDDKTTGAKRTIVGVKANVMLMLTSQLDIGGAKPDASHAEKPEDPPDEGFGGFDEVPF